MRARLVALLIPLLLLGAGCELFPEAPAGSSEGRVGVTATTNLVADLARVVGGDLIEVQSLFGPGVDPHLYRASAGDVRALAEADLVLYGGLELEGRMSDLLDELADDQPTAAVTRDLPDTQLLTAGSHSGTLDPHVWFDPELWAQASATVAEALAEVDPTHAASYRVRAGAYQADLHRLHEELRASVAEVNPSQRVLVTSHDAFGYFGRAFGFEVVAIQGISTAAEAATADIRRVADVVADRRLGAVFVESSVPGQTIDAVVAAAAEQGQPVRVGGELFGDSAGDPGTPEATYLGMLRHNVDLIIEGLS